MDAPMSVLSFVAASLAILLTPGPTNTILAASGAAMGLRKALHLPLAEALGYALAVSLFLLLQEPFHGMPAALAVMRAIASAWLLVSAVRLWRRPVVPDIKARQGAFWRVLVTTMLNPKAMLVGTIVIPGLMADSQPAGVACFVLLSSLAGIGWTALGAALPAALRRHSYRAAALIVGGFSVAAAISAAHA